MKKITVAAILFLILFSPHSLFAQSDAFQKLHGSFANKDTINLQFLDSFNVTIESSTTIDPLPLVIEYNSIRGNHFKFKAQNIFAIGQTDPSVTKEIMFDGIIKNDSTLSGVLTINDTTKYNSIANIDVSENSLLNNGTSAIIPFSEKTANPFLIILFGIVFLMSFIILAWYIKKINGRLYGVINDVPQNAAEFFPMVRISRKYSFLWGQRVIILYDDAVAAFKKRKSKSIAILHEADSKEQLEIFKGIRKKKIIAQPDIEKIIIYPGRLTRTYQLKIKTKAGTFRIMLPKYDSENFIKALASKFPGKVKYANGNLFVSTLVGVLLTGLVCFWSYEMQPLIAWWQQAFIWVTILTFSVVLPFLFAWYDLYKMNKKPEGQNKPKADLSHRKPFRSNALALTFRLVAIASLGLWVYYQFLPFHYEEIIIGSLFLLSIPLSQKSTDKLRKDDTRKPILYLRSFLDDNETTLTPCTKLSSSLGVDPPYYWLSDYGLEDGVRYTTGRFIIKYGYSFWPSRLIRLFFGNPLDTSEEQLTDYFKKYGLVVAIGKPGEKLTTPGASRMYVTNEEWQQTVIDLLKESQIILLQPSTTDGVWWEIDKVLKECKPENIILCMVNYRNHQEYYENFLRRFKAINSKIKIPRSIGNENKTTFITFDKDWQPVILDLKYYSIFRWPFTGNALNLNKTFKDYFDKRTVATTEQ